MPAGSLGSAVFTLDADNIRLVGAFDQAQAKAEQASAAIRAAVKAQTDAIVSGSAQAQAAAAAQTKAAQGAIQASQQAAARFQDMSKAAQGSASAFANAAKAALGFGTAVVGIQVSAAAAHDALVKVAEVTQRATQLQLHLNVAYGTAANQFKAFANAQAQAAGQSNLAVQEGVARFGVLMRGYGLTREQVEKLTKATLDLAAATGTDTVESFERMIGVFRDGGESVEKLGLVLNDQSIKAFANLTKEQRANFEQMDALQKSQIRYTEAMKQAAGVQGTAAQRAQSQAGAWDQLHASGERLALAIGQGISSGGGANLLSALTKTTTQMANFAEKTMEAYEATTQLKQAGHGLTGGLLDVLLIPGTVQARIEQNRRLGAMGIQGADPGMPGGTTGGLSPDAARAAIIAQREEQLREVAKYADQRTKMIGDLADAEAQVLRRQADQREKAYDQEITRLEVERATRLKNLEERERTALAAIDNEARASEKAFQAEIDRLEREKAARTQAAEDAAEAAKREIEAAKQQRDHVRVQEDQQREDARRQEDQQREDARRQQDRDREDAQKAEIKGIEDIRDARVAEIEAAIEKEQERSRLALRHLDDEADAARKASEDQVRRLDQASQREDDRHRKAVQHIDDETQKALDGIDAQLRALDAADRAESNASRIAGLQRNVATAQDALTQAQGTGTPADRDAALQKLVNARRLGDPDAIKKAEAELARIVGQGDAAIKDAAQKLADAEQALREEGVKESRDAQRQQLKDAQDRIKRQADDEKKDEDERTRRRKRDLDQSKDAERQKLQGTLDRIDKAKQAEQDASREELRLLHNGVDAEKKAAQEEIDAAKDKYDHETQILQDRRRDEDRFRDDQRKAQDRQRDDERRAEDEAMALQLQAIQDHLRDERRAIDDHYNGEKGVLTTVRKAMEDSKEAYRLRLEDARLKFQQERDSIKDVYTNEAKTGLIDLQNQAKDNNKAALDQQLLDLQNWEKGAKTEIENNIGRWQSLAQAIDGVADAIKRLPNGRVLPPGGIGPVAPPGYGGQPGGSGDGGRGEELPPPSLPPGSGGGRSAPPPTPIPAQINQYTFDDLSKLEQDAACGPAAIDWFSTMVGHPLTGRQALNVAKAAGWDIERGMHGPNAMSAALKSVGVPNKVNWDVSDELVDGLARRRVPFTMSTGEHYYQIYGGGIGGLNVGGSGLALRGGSSVMSMGDIKARGYTPQAVVIPDESVIHTRDSGYLFTAPTLTYTPQTGEYNLIAERRPELLVGGAATGRMMGGAGLSRTDLDYLADRIVAGVRTTRPIVNQGTSEDIARKVSSQLARERREYQNLRGVRR